jgi:hypothetical protein
VETGERNFAEALARAATIVAQMPSIVPFRDADLRTFCLRLILLGACFFGMVACAPLWLNTHSFPLLPIFPGFPILPSPADKILFGSMLLSLVAAIWIYRAAVSFFLMASVFAYCEDQNRGQPWLYIYWVMLLLTLLPSATAIAGCRWGMSIVYIWSGIQKCNGRFFQVGVSNFIAPATHWHLPSFVLELMRWTVMCAPFLELGIGLALWSQRVRRAAIGAAVVLHAGALLFLGPLGSNYNAVVWPWNLAMPALIWVLFAQGAYWRRRGTEAGPTALKDEQPAGKGAKAKAPARAVKKSAKLATAGVSLMQTFSELQRSKVALAVLALYSLLPILSYYGRWDSYFSFSLYSENSASANVFVTQEFADRLPPKMRAQVQKFEPYDPQRQGPFVFNFGGWCYEELHVPPIAEPRNFRSIFKALQAWSKQPSDLRMIVGQRAGPVIFYEGESFEYLTPK